MTRFYPKGVPLETWGDEEQPDGFIWQNREHHITHFCNHWRVHTRLWEPRETIWRHYLKVATDSKMMCHIYRDLVHGGWFLERVYD
jgi:hypothetical protein